MPELEDDNLDIDGVDETEPSYEAVDGDDDGAPGGEKLYAGKFKTVEEMERAYYESQGEMTRKQQEAAKYRKAVETAQQYGMAYDEATGQWYNPQATQQQYQNQSYDGQTDPWEQAFESGANLKNTVEGVLYNTIAQYDSMRNSADANVEMALAQFEADPLYSKVGRRFRAELKRIPMQQLAHPGVVNAIAQQVYNQCAGEYFRQQSQRVKEDPAVRQEYLASLGVEMPSYEPRSPADEYGSEARAILSEMGLPQKEVQDVMKNIGRRREE